MSAGQSATRALSALRGAWGLVLLVRSGPVAHRACRGRPAPATWVVRLLGARELTQHIVLLLRPHRGLVLAGIGVDVLHAASMVVVAWTWPRYRWAASVSAGFAAGSVLLGAAVAPVAE